VGVVSLGDEVMRFNQSSGIAIVLSFLSGKTVLDCSDNMLIEQVRCIVYGLYRTMMKKAAGLHPATME